MCVDNYAVDDALGVIEAVHELLAKNHVVVRDFPELEAISAALQEARWNINIRFYTGKGDMLEY